MLTLVQSFHAIFTVLVDHSLLVFKSKCQCGTEMVLRERQNASNGFIWECPVRSCRKREWIRARSFFEDSNIPLGQ